MIAVHLFWGDEAYTPEALILAGLIGCVALVAMAYAPPRVLPATPILLSYFYIAMARPTFSPPFIKGTRGPIYVSSRGFELALLGAFCFAVSLFLASRATQTWGQRLGEKFGPLLDPPEPYESGHTMVARVSAVVSLSVWVLVSLRPSLVPPSIALPIALFSSVAIPLGLLFWDAYRTRHPLAIGLFWSVVSFTALLGMSGGVVGAAVMPVLVAASLLWAVNGRIPLGLVLGCVLMIMVFNPAKHRYRTMTWYQDRDIGLEERIEGWIEALSYTYSAQTEAAIDASVESTAYRTSTLPFVALIFETVPSPIPFAGPARWLELPMMFIPRVLWPGKPSHTDVFNNDFTLTFGLQTTRGVETTTLNLPSVGDGFWRLGWVGVFLEGLILGTVLGVFQGATLRRSRALLIFAVGFVVSTQADKHVFHILASLPQYVFATGTILLSVRMATVWVSAQSATLASRAKHGAAPAP
jgi:hypothetical protein